MKDFIGYSMNDDVTAIHGGHSSARSVQPKATSDTGDAPHMGPRNSAAETLHLEQHKYPGDGSSRMVQGYGFLFPKDSSIKRQATSPEAQASSFKPQATSSVILEPRYKNTEEVFLGKGPRAFTMINVLSG